MKEAILVFGAGILQLSIIKRVKLSGYLAIVIDPDGEANAKEIADFFYRVKGDDFNTTLDIALRHNVKGIVTAATDKPILMMCRIAKKLGLIFPSYESCETLLDKAKFKAFLNRNKIPHAKGTMLNSLSNIENLQLKFPIITKPVINSGSRGVIKSNNQHELRKAVEETLEHSRDGRFLVEEFIGGDEISVEALVQNYEVEILQITDKLVTPPPYNVELGHVQPSRYCNLKNEIWLLLQKIVDGTKLNNCALHAEMKILNRDIIIIEVGPRLGGDFITSELVPLSTGVNMEDQMINVALGEKTNYTLESNAALISFFNFPENIIVRNSLPIKCIISKFNNIRSIHLDLKIGAKVNQITNSLNRYGYFILHGKSKSDLFKLKDEVEEFVMQKIFN